MRVWAQALIGLAWALGLVLTDPYIHLNALKNAQGPLKALKHLGPGYLWGPQGPGSGLFKRPPGSKEPGPS